MINVTIDRYKYVGGSDLPTILGQNLKYNKTPFVLALEKARIKENPFKGNEITRYGQLMEPIIREYINAKYNVNYLEDTIIYEKKGYRGNTDGIDRNAEIPILEVKTFGNELDVEYYTAQCQFYMETFNQNACLLVGYKRPSDFYTGIDYEIEHDDMYFNLEFNPDNLEEHVIYRDKDLWNKIEQRITAFKNGVGYLIENKDNYTEEEFNKLFYGNDILILSNKVAKLDNQAKELKNIETDCKNAREELYKLMQAKGIISFETPSSKYTLVNPTTYDTVSINAEKLKEKSIELYNECKVVKTTNRKGYVLITSK